MNRLIFMVVALALFMVTGGCGKDKTRFSIDTSILNGKEAGFWIAKCWTTDNHDIDLLVIREIAGNDDSPLGIMASQKHEPGARPEVTLDVSNKSVLIDGENIQVPLERLPLTEFHGLYLIKNGKVWLYKEKLDRKKVNGLVEYGRQNEPDLSTDKLLAYMNLKSTPVEYLEPVKKLD